MLTVGVFEYFVTVHFCTVDILDLFEKSYEGPCLSRHIGVDSAHGIDGKSQ